MPITFLAVLQGIAAAAGIIAAAKSILEDHDRLNDQLNAVLTDLQGLQTLIVRSVIDILEAIAGVIRHMDEDTAADEIARANTALFNDLLILNDKNEAMGKSHQAAGRLLLEADVVFATAFMYVVNIRFAVVKDFDRHFFCKSEFEEEFQHYISRLNGWIAELNDFINRAHTVRFDTITEFIGQPDLERPGGRPGERIQYFKATHFRNLVFVQSFEGPENDLSISAELNVKRRADDSRKAGIEADRQQLGIPEMESTARAWEQPFGIDLRLTLVREVLNRSPIPTDFNPSGFMIDGRIIPAGLDRRATLVELLNSREFRNRIKKTWDLFVNARDSRLVQFAHRRLFNRDATNEQIAMLREIAETYGYSAFIAALVYSREYDERFGRGLPDGGEPIIKVLETETPVADKYRA